ncbi:uncharacterized protein L969DRAFT_51617 [Mixia osmundae IAM 14324]|uniref:Uncharacterized protein n=1 Tax=Mixia osmundae (strain CBS 9802 / IAM 14324 / JCM 22182 / KY 12970) TaxID=764103 RepID=G7DSJ5_MIXOS|nr:uncharacterized protein L969DRAFT_51617 [Mixia osmundae IAM 14324]KEI37947.1 hypothetical protein L969DRAFT_51617 [Mixia osmundae IAM 14324]GAA93555.1 hypothetical protein E5Q_00200 [Mixia osmundae IAM 14324]
MQQVTYVPANQNFQSPPGAYPVQVQMQPNQMQMQGQPQVQYIQVPAGQLPPGFQYVQQPQPAQGQPVRYVPGQHPMQGQSVPHPQMRQVQQPVYAQPGRPTYQQQTPVMQQPTAASSMVVATSQTNAGAPSFGHSAKRDWTYPTFSSEVKSGILLPWCCPCIAYGQNEERINALEAGKPGTATSSVNGACMTFCGVMALIGCAGAVFVPSQRRRITTRYNINEDSSDGFNSLCFLPCLLSQTDLELTVLERQALGQY